MHTKNIKTIAILFAINSSNALLSMEKPNSDNSNDIITRIKQYEEIEKQLDTMKIKEPEAPFTRVHNGLGYTMRNLYSCEKNEERKVLSQNIDTQSFPSQSSFLNARRACIKQRGFLRNGSTKDPDIHGRTMPIEIFVPAYHKCQCDELPRFMQKYSEAEIQDAIKNNSYLIID